MFLSEEEKRRRKEESRKKKEEEKGFNEAMCYSGSHGHCDLLDVWYEG